MNSTTRKTRQFAVRLSDVLLVAFALYVLVASAGLVGHVALYAVTR